jgi:hypothetical protein
MNAAYVYDYPYFGKWLFSPASLAGQTELWRAPFSRN